MGWQRVTRPLPTSAGAVAGAVAGHQLAYILTVPGASARATMLAQTGHGYWPAAISAGCVLGATALGMTVARRFRAGLHGSGAPATGGAVRGPGPARLAGRLAILQVAIYLVQEVLERVVVNAPLAGLLHDRALVTGVALQLVVAALVAAVLLASGRAAEAAGRVLARRCAPAARRAAAASPAAWQLAASPIAGVPGIRSPPLYSAAS